MALKVARFMGRMTAWVLAGPYTWVWAVVAMNMILVWTSQPIFAQAGAGAFSGMTIGQFACQTGGFVANYACPVVGVAGIGYNLADHFIIHPGRGDHGRVVGNCVGLGGLGSLGPIATLAHLQIGGCIV